MSNVAYYLVARDTLRVSLTLPRGEVVAATAENVVAPPVRGTLKIVELFPEGRQVRPDDVLVQFENADFRQRIHNAEQEFALARDDQAKLAATLAFDDIQLKAAIQDREADQQEAALDVHRKVHEAKVEQEQEQAAVEAKRAALGVVRAMVALEAQSTINKAELRMRRLDIAAKESGCVL